MSCRVRVELPAHLCSYAGLTRELWISCEGPATQRVLLDALEAQYPVLGGTIRDHTSKTRRPFLRFFACGEDLSLVPPDEALPEAVAAGHEPFLIIGAIAGG